MFRHPLFRLTALVLLLAGCGRAPSAPPPSTAPEPSDVARPAASGPLVVFLGDSLTAGYGLPEERAFPAILQAELARRGREIRIVNAGVSGDTTAGGLARVDWLLTQRPDVLVVGLGANDGLRGQPVAGAADNLRRTIVQAQGVGAQVLLVGMQVPRSMGPEYAREFADMYPRLARELSVPLVPFLLEGVAGRRNLNLEDGIHPNAEGQRRLAENVRPHLEKILQALSNR